MKHSHFKQKLRFIFTVITVFAFSTLLSAQQIAISGLILDNKTGEPIIGANIIEKGTTNGTITNFNGEFTLSTAPKAILVIKYVAYKDIELSIGNKKNLPIIFHRMMIILISQ